MNIFVLDKNPAISALYHNDFHVRKMILESSQMLSTSVRINNPDQNPDVYKVAYKHHPCTISCIKSRFIFNWTLELAENLLNEYKIRFDKEHASAKIVAQARKWLNTIPEGPEVFAQAMPDEYKSTCPVEAYRNYYKNEKIYMKNGKYMAVYSKRSVPEFLRDYV